MVSTDDIRLKQAGAMDDRHNEVLAVATLFFVLTWSTVILRCYVRGVMTSTWGIDDWYMVASLVRPAICIMPRHILSEV
jgi:hypothetical protein